MHSSSAWAFLVEGPNWLTCRCWQGPRYCLRGSTEGNGRSARANASAHRGIKPREFCLSGETDRATASPSDRERRFDRSLPRAFLISPIGSCQRSSSWTARWHRSALRQGWREAIISKGATTIAQTTSCGLSHNGRYIPFSGLEAFRDYNEIAAVGGS